MRKARYKIVEAQTRAKVVEKLKTLRDLQATGVSLGSPAVTVRQYLHSWLEDRVRRKVKATTHIGYQTIVDRHIIPHLGNVLLGKLTGDHVQRLINLKLDEGLSRRSACYIHAVLRAALNRAVASRVLAYNPAKGVDLPPATKFRVQPYNPDEARQFLKAFAADRLYGLYVLAIASGMRLGELLALQWDNLNLEEATVSVEGTLRKIKGRFLITKPKTISSDRWVALPEVAIVALRDHKLRQAQERLIIGDQWSGANHVFTTARGAGIDGPNLTKRFRLQLKRFGLRDIRFHDLRHTAASILINSGSSMSSVSKMLGHSALAVTADLYSHIFESTQRETARKMDRALELQR